MAQTVVDQRGRVLIPEEIREDTGFGHGTVVEVEKEGERVVIKPIRKKKRAWKQLCGIRPRRTGKPEWPTPDEIKSIWQ
jgi:AbrB family looped-hinge helix DNA binding protein